MRFFSIQDGRNGELIMEVRTLTLYLGESADKGGRGARSLSVQETWHF